LLDELLMPGLPELWRGHLEIGMKVEKFVVIIPT
jgi:hypothetical protein